MPVNVYWQNSGALAKKFEQIRQAVDGNGRAMSRVKGDIRKIVVADNTEKLLGRGNLEGVDRYGKPLARMADSTYQNPSRGFGPVLVPKGLQSRFITNFVAEWRAGMLVMGWRNIVNKKGQGFAQYHLAGGKHLPRRDIGGISPAGWAKIQARWRKFAADVLKGEA